MDVMERYCPRCMRFEAADYVCAVEREVVRPDRLVIQPCCEWCLNPLAGDAEFCPACKQKVVTRL